MLDRYFKAEKSRGQAGLCENGFLPGPPLPNRKLTGNFYWDSYLGTLGVFIKVSHVQRHEKKHPKISKKGLFFFNILIFSLHVRAPKHERIYWG